MQIKLSEKILCNQKLCSFFKIEFIDNAITGCSIMIYKCFRQFLKYKTRDRIIWMASQWDPDSSTIS